MMSYIEAEQARYRTLRWGRHDVSCQCRVGVILVVKAGWVGARAGSGAVEGASLSRLLNVSWRSCGAVVLK